MEPESVARTLAQKIILPEVIDKARIPIIKYVDGPSQIRSRPCPWHGVGPLLPASQGLESRPCGMGLGLGPDPHVETVR